MYIIYHFILIIYLTMLFHYLQVPILSGYFNSAQPSPEDRQQSGKLENIF